MQKYFISEEQLANKIIDNDDAFHITSVMRCKIADQILVSDGNKTYLVKISSLSNKMVSFEIIKEEAGNNEMPVFVTIFQGYPKGDKMEDIIKHGTELGAYEFYPVMMKRSIVKIEKKKKQSKLDRFNKIAKEAAEQSYRDRLPKVVDILNLKQIDFSSYDYKILCYEEVAKEKEDSNFNNIVKKLKKNDKVAVVIGPEGGIDISEVEELKNAGAQVVSLGNRILRTETVALSMLSIIMYEFERNDI